MATQTTTGTGRNRGARKGSDTPPVVSIGSHMQGKDQKTAVVLTAQNLAKDAAEGIKINRATLDAAAKVISGFHKANDELQTLKQDIDKKRGGLSSICFDICKLGAKDAPAPELRYATIGKLFNSAEAYERVRYQKANKLAELPTAKVALGPSWQTYKSQILRCVSKGLNPEDFATSTAFIEAGNASGNQTRRARTTAGASAGAQTVAGVLESATMRTELSAAVADLVKHLQALPEDLQLAYANKVHRISIAAAREVATDNKETQAPGENTDTGTM
jgi:hypothetical protein